MVHYQDVALPRSVSCKSNRRIIPATSHHARSPSSSFIIQSIPEHEEFSDYNKLLVPCRTCPSAATSSSSASNLPTLTKFHLKLSSFLRSLLNIVNFPTCKFMALPSSSSNLISLPSPTSLGRKVTGTLYGHRRGHVTFAVQYDPRSHPVLLLDLAISTATLVKEMSSGLVRIALECEKRHEATVKLFQEPTWTMYCNGKKCGYAVTRGKCTERDWHVLNTVSRVSVGAGVIPTVKGGGGGGEMGEMLYMRAKFERVLGSRDSQAFYMLNPDNNGGPELSIFLLRI